MKNNLIKISIKDKDYTPEKNFKFQTKEIRIDDLRGVVKTNNYSLITWKGGERKIENFEVAYGSTVDIDSGLSIPKAIERLQNNDLNYMLVTSKSHTKEKHRYHILILFRYPVYTVESYKVAVNNLRKIFPESDAAVLDPARFIFGSPDDCEIHEQRNGSYYDTSAINGLWNRSTPLIDKNDAQITLKEDMEKTPVRCPFHTDNNPSAFVQFSKNNYFIYCSTCNKTFWMYQKMDEWLENITENFYSYGNDVWEFRIVKEEFTFNKIGKEKFAIMTGTAGTPNAKLAYEYIVRNKHLSNLSSIVYMGDINTTHSYYECDVNNGVFYVHYKAIQPKVKDNKAVDKYLEGRFGEHLKFIKEWLAVFCYTNFVPLPTLIFFGGRTGGKSAFTEIISNIYPSLSFQWTGKEENFTYEKEMKFIVIEENSINKISQYQTLKKYSGSTTLTTNKKFKAPYKVRNNMNLCLVSNDKIPVFVETGEMPTRVGNNQFFVWEFTPLERDGGKIKANTIPYIMDRMGHYIRTELKTVYENLPRRNDLRYSIEVPITDHERELFINNATETDHEIYDLIGKLQDIYLSTGALTDNMTHEYLREGYLPSSWLKETFPRSTSLIKNLARADLILAEPKRIKVGIYRRQAFKLKPGLIQRLEEVLKEDMEP